MNLISIAKMTWISLRKKLKSCLPMLYTANIPVMVQIAKKNRGIPNAMEVKKDFNIKNTVQFS